MGLRGFAALCFVLCLGVTPRAQAWTSARVRDVRADLAIAGDGSATVELDVGVEVLGGWLERLDLEGLDEDLVLDEHEPAWLTTDEGARVPARADADAGSVTLRFEKRSAARRGLHRVHVRYAAPLLRRVSGSDPGRVELPWVLPGWEHGLTQAQIVVRGPAGLRLLRDPELAADVHERVEDGRSIVEMTRLLVPRSTAWTVVFDAPSKLFGDEVAAKAEPKGRAEASRGSRFSGAWAALVVLALGMAARRSLRRRAQVALVQARPLVAAPGLRRGLIALSACVAAIAGAYSHTVMVMALLGLGCCLVDRVVVVSAPIPLGRFAPLSLADRKRLRREGVRALVGSGPWADAATCVGALGAMALLVGAVFLSRTDRGLALGLLCALPSFVASSRLRLPRPLHEQVALLLKAAKRSLALSCAMRLLAFSTGDGALSSPRLRVVTATRFTGLIRLDIGVDTRRGQPALVLIAMTQAGSVADQALTGQAGAFQRELSPQGHRAAHILSVQELGAALEAVLSCLAQHSQLTVERMDARQAA